MTPHPLLDYPTDDARRELTDILGGDHSVIRIRLLWYSLTVDGYVGLSTCRDERRGAEPSRRRQRAIVIIGDVVVARARRPRRRAGCGGSCAELEARLRADRLAPFAFTQGDELQGLLAPGADPLRGVLHARSTTRTPTDALGRRARARSQRARARRPSGDGRRSTRRAG